LSLLAIALPRVHAETFRDGDVCEMRLSGPPEEFTREFNLVLTVDQGAVTIPLIGRIPARGLTSSGLATVIENRLKQAKIFTIANVKHHGEQQCECACTHDHRRWFRALVRAAAMDRRPHADRSHQCRGRAERVCEGRDQSHPGGKAQTYSWKALKKDPSLDPKILAGDIIDVEGD